VRHSQRANQSLRLGDRWTSPGAYIAPAEDAGLLDDGLNAHILQKQVAYLKKLLETDSKKTRVIILDTLHVTQMIRPGVLSKESFRVVDLALLQLCCRIAFLWISKETLMQRTIVGRRGTGFARYASKFGKTEKEVCSHFYKEQQNMWLVANNESQIPVRRFDGSEEVGHLSEQVLEFTTIDS